MVDLVPVWDTAAGSLGAAAEGSFVSISLLAHEEIRLVGVATQFVVTVGSAVSRAQALTLGGVETPFTTNTAEGTLLWATPLAAPAKVVIRLAPALSYAILNGELPPGLSLDPSTGTVLGTLGNVPEAVSYTFTVRASNGTKLRDRTFSIEATPVSQPAKFYIPSLRPLSQDAEVGRVYKDLGTYDLDTCVAFTLDILMPDGTLPPLSVVPARNPPAGYMTGMPRGLSLTDLTISGAISAEACPGVYLFEVQIDDPTAPSYMTFRITVTDAVTAEFGVVPQIIWDTPVGDLGSIAERDQSYFAVAAHAIGTPNAVTYALSHYSASLPTGISIDPATGRLLGSFPHVATDTVFQFIVRASVDRIFVDRTFTIKVLNRFNSASTYHMLLRLRANERANLLTAYRTLIDDALIYRPDDPNYGRPSTSDIYLIMGLDGTKDLDPVLAGSEEPRGRVSGTYHAPFKLVLGQHRFGYARDSAGNVVYEVLVRELYDPQARAGGFLTTALVSEQPVAYPQDRSLKVFPNSINNIRRDLVADVGFAVSDDTLRHTIGTDGPELLPLWMRSAQVAGDATTVPGFVPVVVIAYLVPGSVKAASLALAKTPGAIPEMGVVYYFDRYTVGSVVFDSTTIFDGGTVVFDGHTTLFDVAPVEEVNTVKYLNQLGAS